MINPQISCDYVSNSIYGPCEASSPHKSKQMTPINFVPMLLQNGNSCHKVAAKTPLSYSMVSISHSTISYNPPQKCGEHPAKLSPQGRRTLVEKVTPGGADTATKLGKTLGQDLCIQTIRCTMTKEGLKFTVGQKMPFPSDAYWARVGLWLRPLLLQCSKPPI